MDLLVEMAERLVLIAEDQTNDGIIFVSNQSCFHGSELVNKHKCYIWSINNPYLTMETAMHYAKINT